MADGDTALVAAMPTSVAEEIRSKQQADCFQPKTPTAKRQPQEPPVAVEPTP